ncbi:4a-hydroxytetrahydrobiopterin dehydratase [Nocardioides agariphilus]|jgi:4a-hydroxytetrahydrobiopterin dehydratase|uniref:Putative pterin-4-alpha-carbinolamine dehydratase n=1 Tax=Nocardioides agariphilus TaxID=433664 RepID=A0A930YJC5_9ACTN|nr:VOC family protein [Nocardioides agariphilus]MBF4769137.1 4a-hydroxytetrahydrobiopterin dehydratase [Nocardioides agariphilus]
MPETLKRSEVRERQPAGFEVLLSAIEAVYATGDFATGLRFVERIGAAAEAVNHHPDLTLTYPAVHVRLWSHDAGGVTERDLALATTISQIASELGIEATPDRLSRIEIGLDTHDRPAVAAFWAAVLGYEAIDDLDICDPQGRQVTFWLQQSEASEEPRQRFHVDVSVPPDQAEVRIAAALAAGGTLVSREHEPAFIVLADPEGNKVCVCTSVGRD